MAGRAMIGKVLDHIAERYKYVEIRQGAGNRTPQHRLIADFAPEYGFADGRAKCDLGD